MAMTHHFLLGLGPHGFHRIHYTAWGDPTNPKVLICVHGLTRNARDFDFLAATLAADYQVICVDVPGRGQSEWFTHKEDYNYPLYLNAMAAVIARTGAEQVDWLGTSMGGLIGMLLAAQPGAPIRKLVMNDVGPFIPKVAIKRIAAYVGKPLQFHDLADLQRYLRIISAPFGPLTDAQWQHLAVHSSRQREDGKYTFAYDPGIAEVFSAMVEDVNLWPMWDTVKCPVLVLRGAESDVLTQADAEAMTQRGPCAQLMEFAGIGHAPALLADEQIKIVRDWLLAD